MADSSLKGIEDKINMGLPISQSKMNLLHEARADAMGNSFTNLPLSQRASRAIDASTQTTYEPEDV